MIFQILMWRILVRDQPGPQRLLESSGSAIYSVMHRTLFYDTNQLQAPPLDAVGLALSRPWPEVVQAVGRYQPLQVSRSHLHGQSGTSIVLLQLCPLRLARHSDIIFFGLSRRFYGPCRWCGSPSELRSCCLEACGRSCS